MGDMIHCQGCGKEIHRTAAKCPHCGFSQLRGKRYKSRIGAGVLALLLGGLGVHRFYLGQWWGLFYLLLCWTGIPALIALIEGIVFLCTDQQKWDDRYNDGIAGDGSSAAIVVVIAVVIMFVVVSMIGVLAAIAIPAYQDYTLRARVAQVMNHAAGAQAAVSEHMARTGAPPASLQDAGFDAAAPKDVGGIEWSPERSEIVVTMRGAAPIDGKSFALRMKGEGGGARWSCGPVDLPNRYLPSSCRDPAQDR